MREEIAGCIVCDRETAKKVWKAEPEKRHFLYLPDEFIATVPLSNDIIDKIEARKRDPKGYIYKKGDLL